MKRKQFSGPLASFINARNQSRREATFTDTNDHNPLVDELCPLCNGGGKKCEEFYDGGGGYAMRLCVACHGTGTTGRKVHWFDNSKPIARARRDETGLVTCPECRECFDPEDQSSWTGLRHAVCGRRIQIVSCASE